MKRFAILLVLVFAAISQAGLIEQTPVRKTKGTATYTVAPNDAPAIIKDKSDYICDANTDDVQIQAALDALPSQGGKVFCHAGAYSCKNKITVDSNVTLEFESGTKITFPDDHAIDETANRYTKNGNLISAFITNSDHTNGNENIHIIGADVNFGAPTGSSKFYLSQWYAGIWLDICKNSFVEKCTIKDVVYDVNFLAGRCAGVLFSDCNSCTIRDCNASGAGYEGFSIRDDNFNILVENCTGKGNRTHLAQATTWAPTSAGTAGNITFRGIYCSDKDDVIAHITSQQATGKNIIFENCHVGYIEAMGNLDGAVISNNTVGRLYVYAATDTTLKNVTIAGNVLKRIDGNSGLKIRTPGVNGGTVEDITVIGNTFSEVPIYIETTSGTTSTLNHIKIIGNTIDTKGTPLDCIRITNDGVTDIENIDIFGNTLRTSKLAEDAKAVIYIACSSTGDVRYLTVENNLLIGYYGQQVSIAATAALEYVSYLNNTVDLTNTFVIQDDEQSYTTIRGNYIIDAYRLTYKGGETLIENNTVYHVGTFAVWSTPPNPVIVRNNYGIDEETVTTGSPALWVWGATELDSSGGAITATLADGQYIGQIKTIVMTDASTSSTVTIAHHETEDSEVATFDAVDETLVLVWTGTEWATVKATCTFL